MRIQSQDSSSLFAAQALQSADPVQGVETEPKDAAAARSAAHRLEGLFATLLVKEMRGSSSAGLFGEGTSADVYGGWFDQYLGDVLAKRGALHLADSIEHSLARKETPPS